LPDEENNLRPAKSTSGVDLPHNTYSKAPTSSAVGSDGFEVEFENIKNTGGCFHKSTTPENRSEPATAVVHPEIQSQKQELTRDFIMSLRDDRRTYGAVIHRDELYASFKHQANSLAMDFAEIQDTWKQILEAVFPSPKPAPKPNPEPVPIIENGVFGDKGGIWKRSRDFYRYAVKFGWTPPGQSYERDAIIRYLRDTFRVRTPDKLSPDQFRVAWRRLEQGPPKPN
jgi:hypothetical protein